MDTWGRLSPCMSGFLLPAPATAGGEKGTNKAGQLFTRARLERVTARIVYGICIRIESAHVGKTPSLSEKSCVNCSAFRSVKTRFGLQSRNVEANCVLHLPRSATKPVPGNIFEARERQPIALRRPGWILDPTLGIRGMYEVVQELFCVFSTGFPP